MPPTTTATTTPSVEEWKDHAREFVYWITRTCCGVYKDGHWDPPPDPGARAALSEGLRQRPERFPQAAVRAILSAALGHGPDSVRAVWARGVDGRQGLEPQREYAYYTVAALIASQARDARDQQAESRGHQKRSLGHSLALLDTHLPFDEESPREADLRLMAKQGLAGIHAVVPDVVRQLRNRPEPIPVDWSGLILDLSRWAQSRDAVTKRWNDDYYRIRYKNQLLADLEGTENS